MEKHRHPVSQGASLSVSRPVSHRVPGVGRPKLSSSSKVVLNWSASNLKWTRPLFKRERDQSQWGSLECTSVAKAALRSGNHSRSPELKAHPNLPKSALCSLTAAHRAPLERWAAPWIRHTDHAMTVMQSVVCKAECIQIR
jgi:hypothetical protein